MNDDEGLGHPRDQHQAQVEQLSRRLGARLVAYALGRSSTSALREQPGSVELAEDLCRLQALSIVLDTLHEPDQVAAAWLMGLNPQLGDVAPAWLLRERGGPAISALLAAAREHRR